MRLNNIFSSIVKHISYVISDWSVCVWGLYHFILLHMIRINWNRNGCFAFLSKDKLLWLGRLHKSVDITYFFILWIICGFMYLLANVVHWETRQRDVESQQFIVLCISTQIRYAVYCMLCVVCRHPAFSQVFPLQLLLGCELDLFRDWPTDKRK